MDIENAEIRKMFNPLGGEHKYLSSLTEEEEKEIKSQAEKLKGGQYACKVIDVYDGDTCTIIFKIHDKLEKFKFRIYGYDSPEMRVSRSLTTERRAVIKQEAINAKNALLSFLKGKRTVVKIRGFDKYGRLLGDLYAFLNESCKPAECNVTNYMISNGYGYPYKGGTKRGL